jgi:hypothetical protein
MDLILSTDLGLIGGFFRNLQYRRFAVAIKPFWYALAGLGLTAVAHGAKARFEKREIALLDSLGARVVLALLFAPCLFAFFKALPLLVKSPSARPLTFESAGEKHNQAAFAELLRNKAVELGPSMIHRAVYVEKYGFGGRYPLFAIADAGFGFLPTKFIPAQNFKHISYTTEMEMMYRLGASIVISRWPVQHELFKETGKLGIHRVYEARKPSPPPIEVRGKGAAEVLKWGDAERVIRISGAESQTVVTLAMAPYDKWRARFNGREVELGRRQIGSVEMIEAGVAGDGELRLSYENTALESVCSVAGLIALAACIAGLVLRPRRLPLIFSSEQMAAAHGGLCIAAAAVVVIAAVKLLIARDAAVEAEWLAGEPAGSTVVSVLHRQGHTGFEFHPRDFCVRPYTRDPNWGCTEAGLAPRLAPSKPRSGKVPSCISVGVPPRGHASIAYDLPEAATVVKGWLHAVDGSGPVQVRIAFGRDRRAQMPIGSSSDSGRKFRAAAPAGSGQVTFSLANESDAVARACIEAAAIAAPRRP